MDRTETSLVAASLAAAFLLLVLCTLTAGLGVSQQGYEFFAAPVDYAAGLVRDAAGLRWIIGIDDVFIAAYVTSTVLFAMSLAQPKLGPIHVLVIAAGVTAGVIDLEENHHILAMLSMAEHGLPIAASEIVHRAVTSQLKWMFGHVAFALVAVLLPARDALTKAFRATLVFVQLPLGAAVWVVSDPAASHALIWARYLSLISGFLAVAYLARRSSPAPDADVGVDSGVPA